MQFAATRFLRPKERRPGSLEVGTLSKKHRSVVKWLGRHVADNFADLAAGQGEGYGLLEACGGRAVAPPRTAPIAANMPTVLVERESFISACPSAP
jgi:hypothetical protein